MEYKVIIEPSAQNDLKEIINWYNQIQINLGQKFLLSLQNKIDQIKSNPFVIQIKYKEIRSVLISSFPYTIHYYIYKNNIHIISIFHASRNPNLWENRN